MVNYVIELLFNWNVTTNQFSFLIQFSTNSKDQTVYSRKVNDSHYHLIKKKKKIVDNKLTHITQTFSTSTRSLMPCLPVETVRVRALAKSHVKNTHLCETNSRSFNILCELFDSSVHKILCTQYPIKQNKTST